MNDTTLLIVDIVGIVILLTVIGVYWVLVHKVHKKELALEQLEKQLDEKEELVRRCLVAAEGYAGGVIQFGHSENTYELRYHGKHYQFESERIYIYKDTGQSQLRSEDVLQEHELFTN